MNHWTIANGAAILSSTSPISNLAISEEGSDDRIIKRNEALGIAHNCRSSN